MFHYPGLLSMRPTVSGDMTRYLRVCVRARVHVYPGLAAAIVGNRNARAHHRIKQGLVHTCWTTLCQPYAQWAHVFLFTCGQAGGNRSSLSAATRRRAVAQSQSNDDSTGYSTMSEATLHANSKK